MTTQQLIDALTRLAEDRPDAEVAVTTLAAETDGPDHGLADDATVLSVGIGPDGRTVLVIG